MSALNNQTNRNGSRYFFATSENGEQTLGLQFGTAGSPALSTMAVTISGAGGNGVIVNQAPQFVASEFVLGDEAVLGGSASTYFTPSTLTSNFVGFNLTTDRLPGSGITTIEAYGGNGTYGGFEFLNRGVNSVLLSTNSAGMNEVIKSNFGREGAAGVLNTAGTFATGAVWAAQHNSVDYPTGGGGRLCFTIEDVSGINTLNRWSIGTTQPPTGNTQGSDLAIYSYLDDGNFNQVPLSLKRDNGAMSILNISSIQTEVSTGSYFASVYPASKTNVEFGADSNVAVIAGSSNQAFPYMPLLSTPLTGLNPNGQTFLSINWANALSTGSNHVNFKVGFSTGTAYTNLVQTAYVPGGQWTPSDQPSTNTPLGHTLLTGCVDPDGVNPDGSGVLYVLGQLSDPNATADQIFIAKGLVTEATRNALVWRPI